MNDCRRHWYRLIVTAAMGLLLAAPGMALARTTPTVGSRNVAIADPAVPRPGTTPCVVKLFTDEDFGAKGNNKRMDAIPHHFRYAPPEDCKGPWSKVVLEADFSVDAGRQYDRTASFWFKGVNVYFGTTEEPSRDVSPHWQIQRDLTAYSSLFRSPGSGQAWINNWVDNKLKPVIHVSARLLFYPANKAYPAPDVPDEIVPLNGDGTIPANLKTGSAALERTVTFPRNTSRVFMDVFAQPQFHDEFYYMCLDQQFIRKTSKFALKRGYQGAPKKPRACGGGSFREVEVRIDGKPAGLAPISPWVFTGGIDPMLWRPTPGDETLNFMPYRVNLTPFAGELSDGKPHTVSVHVLGADNFFSVAAALLVYRKPGVEHTGGAITRNTLQGADLEPSVRGSFGNGQHAGVNGNVTTRANTHYVIEGYIHTPKGKVKTRVENRVGFSNVQIFSADGQGHRRHVVRQVANVHGVSHSTGKGSEHRMHRRDINYSLDVDTLRSGSREHGKAHDRSVQLKQTFERHIAQRQDGAPLFMANVRNTHVGADHISYDPDAANPYKNLGQSSTQTYSFNDSLGDCYWAQVQARSGTVVDYTQGQGCPDYKSSMHWFVHPDGSPDTFGWRAVNKGTPD